MKGSPLLRPLRLGVVGAGGIAQSSHFPAIARLRAAGWPVSLAALADPDPARIAAAVRFFDGSQENGETAYRTYVSGDALLAAGDIDAVLLLTPPSATAPLIENALTRNLPVLAEKPAAHDAQTLRNLERIEAAAPQPIARIAYNRRSMPLADGFVSRLHAVRENGAASGIHMEARLWRASRTDAIFYDDTMVHALDFLLLCLGPLRVERAEWGKPQGNTGLRQSLRVAFVSESDGDRPAVTAHLDVRPAVGRNVESYELLGVGQAVTLTYPVAGANGASSELMAYENGTLKNLLPETPPFAQGAADNLFMSGFLPQLADFLCLVSGDTRAGRNLCTVAQARRTAELRETLRATRPSEPDEK